MKAILCRQFGPPDQLELADIDPPAAQGGEVVVRIAAIGLNFFDTLLIAGKYQVKPPFPFSPGAEFSGVIESVGAGVTGLKPGDRVFGSSGHGAAREMIAIEAGKLILMPAGLDFDHAAAITATYGTSLYALTARGKLKPGETLAVLGAAGGVGLAAVELGKLLGARVIACASSDEKLALTRAHGADETVNYAAEDLRGALGRVGGAHGIDVIYDPVGGRLTEAALRAIAWEGRHLVIGFASGEIPKLPLNLALLKSCDVVGVFWGAWAQRDPAGYRADLTRIAAWCAEGKLRPHIQQAYPLADTAQALNALAAGKVLGKLIVHP